MLQAIVFLFHVKVDSVGAEKNIAWQAPEDLKTVTVVVSDVWINLVADKFVAGIHIGAADDDYMHGLAVFGFVDHPGCCSPGVAGGEMRSKGGAAERDLLTIVKDVVDVGRREVLGVVCGVLKVGFAAGFNRRDIRIHDVVFGPSEALDFSAARAVIEVGMTDEKNFGVAEIEAQCFDALLDLERRRREVAVDQDVSLGGDDQVRSKVFAAYVVKVARDAEWRERLHP